MEACISETEDVQEICPKKKITWVAICISCSCHEYLVNIQICGVGASYEQIVIFFKVFGGSEYFCFIPDRLRGCAQLSKYRPPNFFFISRAAPTLYMNQTFVDFELRRKDLICGSLLLNIFFDLKINVYFSLYICPCQML